MDFNTPETPDLENPQEDVGTNPSGMKLVPASDYFNGGGDDTSDNAGGSDNDDLGNDEEQELAPKDWFLQQAEAFGVDLDKDSYKDVEFTAEEAKQEVARALAYKHVATQDPLMAQLMDTGMTIAEYLKESDGYRAVLAMDDQKVFEGTIWNKVRDEMVSYNQLAVDDKGNLTPESEKEVTEEAKRRFALYDDNKRKKIAEATKAQYKKHLDELPTAHSSRLQEMEQKQWEAYTNPQIEKIANILQEPDMVKSINDEFGLDIDAKGFGEYVKTQLAAQKGANGKLDHKIIQRFKEDPVFMKKILASAYAAESGKIQDIKKNVANKALKNMGISGMPKGKNSSGADNTSRSSGTKLVPADKYFNR